MRVNLYELFDSAEADELEPFLQEAIPALPEGVSLTRIKSQVRQKTVIKRTCPFRWQHLATLAACLCIVIVSVWGMGKRQMHPMQEDTPAEQLQHGEDNVPAGSGSDSSLITPDEENDMRDPDILDNAGKPPASITLRSLSALEEMRSMAETEDEEALEQYLYSIEGQGADSREDLVEFLNILDSLPIPEIIDGTVTFLEYCEEYEYFQICISTEDGSWIRNTYLLSEDDIPLEDLYEAGQFEDSLLNEPLHTSDGLNSVYNENRVPHPSGQGSRIEWDMELNGIQVNVYYFTQDPDAVDTEEMFRNMNIADISDYAE